MLSSQFDRRPWSELASVGFAVAAGTVLFFEILRSQFPEYLRSATQNSTRVAALAFLSSIRLSMLFAGTGVIAVSGIRLFSHCAKPIPEHFEQ